MISEAHRLGLDDPSITGEGEQWEACPDCGWPTDAPEGGPHAMCGTFYCPGECGTVIRVPMLACRECRDWVRAEDDAALIEAAIAEGLARP